MLAIFAEVHQQCAVIRNQRRIQCALAVPMFVTLFNAHLQMFLLPLTTPSAPTRIPSLQMLGLHCAGEPDPCCE